MQCSCFFILDRYPCVYVQINFFLYQNKVVFFFKETFHEHYFNCLAVILIAVGRMLSLLF